MYITNRSNKKKWIKGSKDTEKITEKAKGRVHESLKGSYNTQKKKAANTTTKNTKIKDQGKPTRRITI